MDVDGGQQTARMSKHTRWRSIMTAVRTCCCCSDKLAWKPCVRSRLSRASCRVMAAATDTLKDCANPLIGMMTAWSAASSIS